MTMKSVGTAAQGMVKEVRRQFQDPEIRAGTKKPDYAQCVAISTQAALKEMIAPGALVIFSPILVGYLFGTRALAGLLAGALVSGVQMAVSASNTVRTPCVCRIVFLTGHVCHWIGWCLGQRQEVHRCWRSGRGQEEEL